MELMEHSLSSSLAMPTTAKTLIRRVLELPLPKEGSVRIAGIDEWAWKKGSRYGTILVDLEHRRVAALLPERSVESSTAWFKKHPEVKIVSRDRGKIFRAAAIGRRSPGQTSCRSLPSAEKLCRSSGEVLWSPQASAQKGSTAPCWKDTFPPRDSCSPAYRTGTQAPPCRARSSP